ncbi:MAG TPA: hypothetical protein VMV77_08050 [Bacteroidales bacterium]|nr:hypothetical protein [Bacteroidales bacterium]
MKNLLKKLNYKGQRRIAVINAEENFLQALSIEFKDVIIDKAIDLRCPYDFILLFVKNVSEIEFHTPIVIHNLMADGVLWFCYPKKTSRNLSSDIYRDHGWKALNDYGFYGIRMVAVDADWSAMRFRNIKYIKSTSGRFPE